MIPEKAHDDSQARLMTASLSVGPPLIQFAAREVPEACLEHLIELARLAPSELNFQPWRWIIVRSSAGKQELESSTYIKVPLSSAPVALICLADTLAWKTAPQHLQERVASKKMSEQEAREALRRLRDYYSASPELAQRAALANAFMAMHQMLLAASDCELSAYWVTEFHEQKVKTYFHDPDRFLVAALLFIGYRGGAIPPPVSKLPL